MGWLGKVIGGTLGLALAGPVGAVAGAVFGHMFDSDGKQQLFPDKKALTPDERAQMTFSDKYYAILGCDRNDTNEHIKQQYRKLVRDFHPDTIASKGLPEEFIKFAKVKFREIQGAYELIEKERNL